MAFELPGIQELIEQNLSIIEQKLGVSTPQSDKAYNRVLAAMLALSSRSLYLCVLDRALAMNALTAKGGDLDLIGEGYEIYRAAAQKFIGTVKYPVLAGLKIPLGTVFVSDGGVKYQSMTDTYGDDDNFAIVQITSEEYGASPNLQIGNTLNIQVPISGGGNSGEIAEVLSLGTDEESDDDYRQKVLDAKRSDTAIDTAGALRGYAQEVGGVARAYPFGGRPIDMSGDSLPGERTVYIEAAADIDPDGIAPADLLALVKKSLTADPSTGKSRITIGLTADTLYVRSIVRTGIYVTIIGMSIGSGDISLAKQKVKAVIETLLRGIEPYVEGLDAEFDRNDKLTESLFMVETQNTIDQYGGTVQNILFGKTTTENLSRIDLRRNEKLSLKDITFVDE